MLPKPKVIIPPLRFTKDVPSMGSIPSLHGIYRIQCVALGICYVGQAYDMAHRALEHQVHLRERVHTNSRLQAAYNKYGPRGFLFEVLEVWTGKWKPDCLSPAEQRWMDAHQGKLFNIRPAGSDEWQRVTGIASSPRGNSGLSRSSHSPAGSPPAVPAPPRAVPAPPRPLGRRRPRGKP